MYNIYVLMCDFSHSGAFAVYRIANVSNALEQKRNCRVPAWFATMFIYMFIAGYADVFERSRRVVKNDCEMMFRIDLWQKVAKDAADNFYKTQYV